MSERTQVELNNWLASSRIDLCNNIALEMAASSLSRPFYEGQISPLCPRKVCIAGSVSRSSCRVCPWAFFFFWITEGALAVLISPHKITAAPVRLCSAAAAAADDGESDYDLFKGGGWCFHLTFPLKICGDADPVVWNTLQILKGGCLGCSGTTSDHWVRIGLDTCATMFLQIYSYF